MKINEDYFDFDDNEDVKFEPSSFLFDLSKDEIKKMEVDFRFKTVVSLSCPLSMYMSGKYKETTPFELIFKPYHKTYFINEGLIKTVDADTVKRLLLKYSDSNVYNSLIVPEWLKQIYISADNAKEQMLDYFPLTEEQIEIKERHDGIKYILVVIPDIGKNVELIKKALSKFGYFCSTPIENSVIMRDDNISWLKLQFEPCHQEIITKLLKNEHKFLYHVSPTKFEHKIVKMGLCPSSKNDYFVYPSRVYMMMDYRKIENRIQYASKEYMTLVAATLLSAKINSHNVREDEYVNDFDWTCYSIDISKLKEDFISSYDANFYPLSIFTVENIQKDAITIIDRFNLKEIMKENIKNL